MQEVSGLYTSPFLDTDERKMALRACKVSGAFDKRAPDLILMRKQREKTSYHERNE